MKGLTFDELRVINRQRSEKHFFPLEHWSLMKWGCALAGEAGEACNVAKKIERVMSAPQIPHEEVADLTVKLAHELADVVTYADLLASRARIHLGDAVVEKFNLKSKEIGSDIFLLPEATSVSSSLERPKLGIYKHANGGLYRVLGLARGADASEALIVTYEALDENWNKTEPNEPPLWRYLQEWNEPMYVCSECRKGESAHKRQSMGACATFLLSRIPVTRFVCIHAD